MAPELKGKKKEYAGPPVDIFAMGVILFIMCFAKFPFGEAGDPYHKMMQATPENYMKKRHIKKYSAELLDLMVGMTKSDATERYNMETIRSHPWFQGKTVSEDDQRKHFYSVMPGKKVNDHKANQAKKAQYGQSVEVQRSGGDYKGASEGEVSDWKELKYKNFDQTDAGQTGFFATNALGAPLFGALSEYLGEREINYKVSENTWKMTFDTEQTVIEECEGEAAIKNKVSVVARIFSVTPDKSGEDDEFAPEEVYMTFKRANGCPSAFNNFFK